jgi:hypothetical protein
VPLRGLPGRLAAVIVLCVLAVVIGAGLAGQGEDRTPERGAAVIGPTSAASPTARSAADSEPTPVDEMRSSAVCEVGEAVLPTGGTPLPDMAAALPGDGGMGPLPLGSIDVVPDDTRLDFLFQLGCFRDAHWIDPQRPGMGSGVWTAGRPFHVREGFVNNGNAPLGEGFDVVLYVTRMSGQVGPTYRYTSDYVLRGTSDRCGPTYRTQTGPETCEWFVHDFPEGLPEGRFAIWAVWEAPCQAWVELGLADSCADPDEVISLFSSGFDAPYTPSGPKYTEVSS